MTITELASLAEIIGAAAVVVTLIYLAFQTRQNGIMLSQSRDAQTAAMVQANMSLWQNLYGKILESPDVAGIFRTIKGGEEVAVEDQERLEAMLVMWVLALENLVFQSRLNPFVEDIEHIIEAIIDQNVTLFMASNSSRKWWKTSRRIFGPDVVQLIDAALLRQSNESSTC